MRREKGCRSTDLRQVFVRLPPRKQRDAPAKTRSGQQKQHVTPKNRRGSVAAAGHRRRVYDAVVFKVLGADRRRVLGGYLLEYGMLGLLTAVIGAGVGTAAAWGIVVHLMKSDWAFDPAAAGTTALFCLAVTLAMGLFGTWRAMGRKAMPLLRNQ